MSVIPSFDGRIVLYPSLEDLKNYLSWRQVDCHINNLYNTTFWSLVLQGGLSTTEAHQELKGSLSKDKHEILFTRFGVNYNELPAVFKRGTLLIRQVKPQTLLSDAAETEQAPKCKQKATFEILELHEDLVEKEAWYEKYNLNALLTLNQKS